MQPLGAYCGGYSKETNLARDCDETTPVIWHGNLVMVEHHREFRVRNQRYKGIGDNSLIIDKIPGSANIAFASAHVSSTHQSTSQNVLLLNSLCVSSLHRLFPLHHLPIKLIRCGYLGLTTILCKEGNPGHKCMPCGRRIHYCPRHRGTAPNYSNFPNQESRQNLQHHLISPPGGLPSTHHQRKEFIKAKKPTSWPLSSGLLPP